MKDDRRLIEDYIPIRAISAEASREKNVRRGHISTLHLWWARRPPVPVRRDEGGVLCLRGTLRTTEPLGDDSAAAIIRATGD